MSTPLREQDPSPAASALPAASNAPAPGHDNLWHRDWMQRTENAYEWWYFDTVSEGAGDYALVVIFLLGSPFSPYTRECALRRRPNPIDYNGVFLALHRRGKLRHYLYARYPAAAVSAAAAGPLLLRFGGNSWRQEGDGSFTILIDEENANRRRVTAQLRLKPAARFMPDPVALAAVRDSPAHTWLPVMVGGVAECAIELRAPAESREPERIRFRGSAYHDHNWGTLPFDTSVARWLWARADFASGHSAVLYVTTPAAPNAPEAIVLLTCRPGKPLQRESDASVCITHMARNGYGVAYPRAITAAWSGHTLVWRFGHRLESTPFYTRCRIDAEWRTAGNADSPVAGHGIGELLRPRGMSSWLVAQAMRLRMYEPGR